MSVTLNLRPAVASDFKAPDNEGNLRYLYGKTYAVKLDEGFALIEFKNNKLHNESFAHRYKEGSVYVIENENEFGLLQIEESN